MKPKMIIGAICALSLLAVIAAVFVYRNIAENAVPAEATLYRVKGEVRSIDAAENSIRIAHEEIPDYMPAMVMPFSVKEKTVLKGLLPGDRVSFHLVVTEDDSWISSITREQAQHAAAAGSPEPDESERVQKGETMPDFTLTDQEGRAMRLSDFRGKAVLVTFIYTRCPLPNFCPLMSKNFADLQERLSKKLAHKYQLISVTMDPAFDTPEVLKDYASRYDADPKDWRFGTGTPEQIGQIATAMGLHYQWENGLINHDLRTALIGPDGRLVHLWKSNVWTPYEVERMTTEVMANAEALASR